MDAGRVYLAKLRCCILLKRFGCRTAEDMWSAMLRLAVVTS